MPSDLPSWSFSEASQLRRCRIASVVLTVMQIGVILSTLCTLLILVSQNFEQLLTLRLITGIGLGFTISAPFPIAAELMPAQHRRTYAAIYEVMLATAFTLLPFVAFVLADHPSGFRLVVERREQKSGQGFLGPTPGVGCQAG